MSIDWERGRPVEEIVEAMEEFHPGLPENSARDLTEMILSIDDEEGFVSWWNTLAMVNYSGFKGALSNLVADPERGELTAKRAKTWLLEVSERRDSKDLFGY